MSAPVFRVFLIGLCHFLQYTGTLKHTCGDLGSDEGRTAQMKPPPLSTRIVDDDLRDFSWLFG